MKSNRKAIGGRSSAPCSPSYYTFRNRDGQTFQLRGDLTMEDLVRMGYGDIRLVQPETPLKPHEWRADTKNECLHNAGHKLNGVGMWICLACRADITPENAQADL
jgi:hypothetical protein